MNAQDLATMAATLAASGTNPVTKKKVMDPDKVPGVLAVMATVGCMTIRGNGFTTRDFRPRAELAAASLPLRQAASVLPSCHRHSTTPAIACALSGRSPTS